MTNANATATATTATATATASRTVRLMMGDKQAVAILFPEKGHAERTERMFDAVAPLLSTWFATGGNRTDFQESAKDRRGALVTALWASHRDGKGNARKIGAAWAAISTSILIEKQGKAFSSDQVAHDAAILDFAVRFMTFFPAPALREKPADYESPSAKISRLEAENAALRIECAALKEQTDTPDTPMTSEQSYNYLKELLKEEPASM